MSEKSAAAAGRSAPVMHPWVWRDGGLVTAAQAPIAPGAGGLHYAVAVLEGIRVYAGRAFRLRAHSERLLRSAAHVGLRMSWSAEQLDAAVEAVIDANGMLDGYIRPLAWRGDLELRLSTTEAAPTHVAVMARPFPSRLAHDEPAGMALATSRWARPPANCLPVSAKCSASYLIGSLAHAEAVAAGYDDALLLDSEGRVCESTGSNLFAVLDGTLVTPPPYPALAGITRATVLELAAQRGIEVWERHIAPAELSHADEVFLSGTALEIVPVTRIDSDVHRIGDITRQMVADYRDLVVKESL
ncbi:aminotransferase class IV [Streptomyces gobiensis]|uniref:aminotransferase class IV n=1 Tax=Streptomyces gobiensis TaxID=2875706 RepID=UPI001E5C9BE3|nr:aminotransferase class IV [Streptomyces gobiensis]UGY93861.1 aminotransferase class IV [Streptomyces gobiensis]